MIKIVIAIITVIVLVAGLIQGAVSYAEYCDQDVYSYYDFKYCDFISPDRQHDPDVNFLGVVIVSGIAAFSWVSDNQLI